MGRRETALVEEMRRVRAALDALPEQPNEANRRPTTPVPPREERLSASRARRQARLSAPLNIERLPTYRDVNGVTVIYGPAPLLEAAYQSGEAVRVLGSNGALYPVRVEKVLPADRTGRCVAWPVGTAAKPANLERLAVADRDHVDGAPRTQGRRRAKRNPGRARGGRSR